MSLKEIYTKCQNSTNTETECITAFLLHARKANATLQECYEVLGVDNTQYFGTKYIRPLKQAILSSLCTKENIALTEEEKALVLGREKPESESLQTLRLRVRDYLPHSQKTTKIDKLTSFVDKLI